MGRRVFLSVLGSTNYVSCYYVDKSNNYRSSETRFVQEASLELIEAKKWDENSVGYVFVTEGVNGSFDLNWKDNGHINRTTKNVIISEGLETRIKQLNLLFDIKPIKIDYGNNEKEIWQIFNTIYSCLMVDDEIYFDITHGFRYLPMLVLVLNNYSKFLLTTSIKRITYGNYESRNLDTNEAPLIDLTSFSVLQDWTIAASEFTQYGNVNKLTELLNREISPILKETKGKNLVASQLNRLNKNLPVFVKNIQTCRGKKIVENKEGIEINNVIQETTENLIKPLKPILDKVAVAMKPFEKHNNIRNGFQSVKWCLNNGLIQQGITLLKETITSLICEECNLDFTIEVNRNIVDSVFTIIRKGIEPEKWAGDAKSNMEITRMIINNSKMIYSLAKEFDNISSLRNDIDHAGFKNNSISNSDKFETLLKDILCDVLIKIN